jgi:two-component system cell cycle sensor histidine kinase/response regulator CckA
MIPTHDRLDHTARILVVDDDASARAAMEAMLAPEGYVVLAAASGKEALAIVAQHAPDLMLLDVIMPDMDGYDVVRMMKAKLTTRNVPVIMITSLGDREAKLLGLSAGAEDFLTKPIDRAELCVRVRNLLRLKAYGDYSERYNQLLEAEVDSRTTDLRDERDRAQRYLDTAEVILLALDREGRVTLVNRYACALLGWSSGELLGHEFSSMFVPPRMRSTARARFDDVIRGDSSIIEGPVLTRSGEERLIEWRNTLVRDVEDQVVGTFSSGTDITERSKSADALRTAEERMRFALRSADVGIWDMDYTTGVLQWSETNEAHYGLRPGTFGGTFEAFVERVHPDDRRSVTDTLGFAMTTGADFSIPHRSIWPDGRVHWLTGQGRVLLGDFGQPVRGVGITQDATERRTLEKQYQQAQKMEAIGQLASGVAHDFNNLLTVILGFSEMLVVDAGLKDDHKRDLDEIAKAARRASGLTTQLLAFSRQQVLKTAPLDVNALITDMIGMLRRLIGEHIEVVAALAPALSPLLADRSQLEQVVMNLMVNARDAMPDGGRITIETAAVDLENSVFHEETVVTGRYIVLAVTDTGVGMSEDTKRHLFEPFFTTKKAGEGTGLGLSTIYGIVKQSNGYIWVYTELGLGTTFKVYLPRADGKVLLPHAGRTTAPPGKEEVETLLLVEDEAAVRELSKRILGRAGYRVLEAANGLEAERVFMEHRGEIDLVVTDVIMPDCGGPELLTRLRAHVPALRVLYMSGYTEQTVAHRAAISQSPFVQKPFTAAELERQVRRALDLPKSAECP